MPAYATERLKDIDRIATPAACAVGRLGALASRRRRPAPQTLVVRPGGMGDLIMAQLAVEDLGRDPSRDIMWLIERRSAAWANALGLPYVAFDETPLRVAAELAGRYRLVVNTEQRFGLSQAAALLAARGEVVGFDTNLAARTSARTVPYDAYDTHERVAFRALLAGAWRIPDPGGPSAQPRRRQEARHRLVLVSGRQSPTRAVALEGWIAAVREWAPEGDVLVGAAPVDAAFADALAHAVGGTRHDVGFGGLVDLVATARDVLTLDGGPVHMASYFGVPVRAIFTSGRDRKWHPLGVGSTILRTPTLPCQPCTLWGQTPPCPNQLVCHRFDPAQDVGAAV